MSILNSTIQNVLEPVLYKKEQEITIQKPLKGSDTFFVKDKDGEIMYVSRYDAIRILERQRMVKYQKSEKDGR
ncbi:hypothetical protein LEP1GSC132_2514 [Leptospira kirschneri str. 200803703]|uniref:hypothetical protein n=1 Tax=Leptospira kirschneri TaxID=29507 RepID=UPI0002C01A93|nr:hypothetical protein [Leptospira kirschneri]EMO66436.1 hypothetical protein LEP1GSC132_2514 [Leptospira kirschneri str. 200803703]